MSTDALLDQRCRLQLLRPGDVTPDLEERIVTGMIAAMPDLNMAAYFAARRSELASHDHLLVAEDPTNGQIVGALASAWRTTAGGQAFLHLPLHMIGGGRRGTGLFLRMWQHHWAAVTPTAATFPSVVALRTYHPMVFAFAASMRDVASVTIYPYIDGTPQDGAMVELATAVAATIAPGYRFDPELGIIRGCGKPPDLYAGLPGRSTGAAFEYFNRHVGPADRLLCVARIDGLPAKQAVLARFGVDGRNDP